MTALNTMSGRQGQTLYFTDENIVFDLIRHAEADQAERLVFSLDFLGANRSPVIHGGDKDTAVVNYFIGNDPDRWHTDIPTYREITYSSIYPDIDLRLYGKEGALEYEFVVKPGAGINDIALAYSGVDSLAIEDGELVAGTAFGDVKQTQPYIYQQIADEVVEVDGGFRLAGGNAYGFEVAAYDSGYPLIIDPTLGYSTFLGGSSPDKGYGIAVDAAGCAYVTGYTKSADFPMLNSYNGTHGGWDAFVAKFNPAGNTLAYSTFLGGAGGEDYGYGIAVDASGCPYVTGYTQSPDFPTTPGSFNGTYGGNTDAFVTKFSADGSSLVFSTFLGGAGGGEYGYGIAVDAAGCAYVTGQTLSADFPMLNSFNGTYGGNTDAFVTRFSADGSSLIYSTFLGGAGGADCGNGIAVDASGCPYVTGYTSSADFPMQSPFQGTWGGGNDAFVTKLNPDGNTLAYSTFLGDASNDYGRSIAVDASGCAYVTGDTNSVDFPMLNPFQGTYGGNFDAFVTRFNAVGNTLAYSTFLGGTGNDYGRSIAVDASGCPYVTGQTNSADFPMQSPFQGTWGGGFDAFVTRFNAVGNTLAYSTFLGGAGGDDHGWGIAVDPLGCAYVTGDTNSADFPMLNPFQGTWGGGNDAFVTKLGNPDITVTPTSLDFGSVTAGSSGWAQTVTVRNDGCGSLTIGTITLGGTNAGEFAVQNDNCSGQTLAPGASATVEVVFNPTSAGTKTATLSIPSGDPDEATTSVTLSGTGTQATQQRGSSGGRTVTGTQGQLPPEVMLVYMNVTPQQQYAGQPVIISTNVSNTGGSTGQYTVTLMINGQVEETRLVSVGAQSALPVTFTVTRDVPGTYDVTIGSQQASFTIVGSSTTGSSASGGLIAIVLVGVLVLVTAVVLLLALRRRAW